MNDAKPGAAILVIDDEPFIIDSYRDFLEDNGYDVFSADNGKTGIEVFERENIDIVIVDLRMPEVDGFEVLRYVSANSLETPLIVVSGTGGMQEIVKALRLGAWDYLFKPIENFSVLKHSVENVLEKSRLRIENRKYQEDLERKVQQRTSELENLLLEKESMLQEIHHRVKNNMAVISAFLSLKELTQDDNEVKNTFHDMQQRIKTMSLVHEKLYLSENLYKISVHDYLSDLMGDIIQNYQGYYGKDVTYELDLEEFQFSIETLIPLGLILNELIINSFKYAFDYTEAPLVCIKMSKAEDEMIDFRISDNGIGYDVPFDDQKKRGIGLEIVNALVQQLNGSITNNANSGTEYIIRFPINDHGVPGR